MRFEGELEQLRLELKIPGMSAAIVKNRSIVWAKGFGYADETQGVAATPQTQYGIASLTEIFVAALIILLAQEGGISLDRPVTDYGVATRKDRQITVRELLTHTSGISYRLSAIRHGYLGQVIRYATGKDFGDALVDRIIRPLNLTFTVPCCRGRNQESNVYRMEAEGAVKPSFYRDSLNTSGGLISSVTNIAAFDIAIDSRLLPNPKEGGWFAQNFGEIDIFWQYGFQPNAVSSVILKVPGRSITFIILANSEKLSEPFSLHHGDVLNSPAALLFLSRFVLGEDDAVLVRKKMQELGEIILKSTGQKTLLNHLEQVLLLVCSFVFLFTVIFWPLLLIVDIIRKKFRIYFRRRAIIIFLARFSGTAASFIGLWLMGALRKFPALIYWHELPGYFDGIPAYQNLTLALPTILTVWAIIPLFFTAYLWKKRYISLVGRLHYTAVMIATLVLIIFLSNWHLVGIEYYWNLLLSNL